MIRRIQTLNYRCLRCVDVALDRFHVLVGPNASGKSTLFDALAFLGDLVQDGLQAAVTKRTQNFRDLVWAGDREPLPRAEGGVLASPGFELAVEFQIPDTLQQGLPEKFRVFRYEIAIREDARGLRIDAERGLLMSGSAKNTDGRDGHFPMFFPAPQQPPPTILLGGGRHGNRTILSKALHPSEAKADAGTPRDNFYSEVSSDSGKGWSVSISFGPQRSALGNLPESPGVFPVASHVKRALEQRVKPLFFDSLNMRRASPPHLQARGLAADGSNLPWAIKRLRDKRPEAHREWLEHLRLALPELADIRIVERPDDRHAYLKLCEHGGAQIPSWMVSDGTLRLLALTLPAYLPDAGEIYLLEEPENGIHPLAIEYACQSLRSVHGSQLLLATHSPLVLQLAEPEEVLCFAKDPEGATDIVYGSEHPRRREWQGEPPFDMESLFARGVFG